MLAVGIAVPLAVVGAINLRGMWSVSRSQLNDSVEQQSELAAIAFERWVDAQRQPLNTIAAIAANRKLDDPSFSDLRFVVQTRPQWIDLRIVDAEGNSRFIEPSGQEPPPSALIQYLLAETNQRKSWALMTDRTRDEARPIFAIAVPIEGRGGAVIARIDGSAISELFGETKFPEQAVIAVFDSEGHLLYRRQSAKRAIATEVSGSPLFAALGDRRLAVTELASPYDEVRRVYGLARAGATKFVVTVGVPSATLYEPARQQFVRYLYFSLLALACTIIAALLIERGITRPIRRLRAAAQSLGAGNLSTRAPLSTTAEIGELSAAFNTMAAQIAEREERLTELDRLKSEFVSSVSHELRTPLTTIKTLTHVLLRGQLKEPERREHLETIAAECDRQIDLVLNLLDLSRIESGAFKVSLGKVNPAEVVAACTTFEQHAAKARQQSLQMELAACLPCALSDKGALRRVLRSLIENAMKYTPEGGHVTVGARVAGDELALYVKDTGCGIMAEDLPHIFEKFYRGRPISITESTVASEDPREWIELPGIGLGLYIVRSIMDQLGGRVTAENAEGGVSGTIFTLYLPVWREEGAEEMLKENKDVEAFARG